MTQPTNDDQGIISASVTAGEGHVAEQTVDEMGVADVSNPFALFDGDDGDTPESLQAKILEEEHRLLPYCVEKLCRGLIEKQDRKVIIK